MSVTVCNTVGELIDYLQTLDREMPIAVPSNGGEESEYTCAVVLVQYPLRRILLRPPFAVYARFTSFSRKVLGERFEALIIR